MGDAVIIDDGGSTRIKLLNAGVGAMNALLDVGALPATPGVPVPAGTIGSQELLAGAYTTATVLFQDKLGNPFAVTVAGLASCEIASGNLRVRADVTGANSLGVTVYTTNEDPLVEAKQHKKKRRYVVVNAPPIDSVTVNGALVAPPGGAGGAKKPLLYTSVVLT